MDLLPLSRRDSRHVSSLLRLDAPPRGIVVPGSPRPDTRFYALRDSEAGRAKAGGFDARFCEPKKAFAVGLCSWRWTSSHAICEALGGHRGATAKCSRRTGRIGSRRAPGPNGSQLSSRFHGVRICHKVRPAVRIANKRTRRSRKQSMIGGTSTARGIECRDYFAAAKRVRCYRRARVLGRY